MKKGVNVIRYTTSLEGISPEMLTGFFVNWLCHPSVNKHFELLNKSYKVVLAIDDNACRVVGFITAISDGILAAYIPLLEVLPSYQKQGIGKKLVENMFEELSDIYMVDLICDENLQEYYGNLGFLKAKGMISRNFASQSGR